MGEVKITDLVPESTMKELQDLNAEMVAVLTTYTDVAKELAKGLTINVKVTGDLDKIREVLTKSSKDAVEANKRLIEVSEKHASVLNETTNVISRNLMEQERVNKAHREEYTGLERANKILEEHNDTYDEQIKSLVKLEMNLDKVKKAMKENKKNYESGLITEKQYRKNQEDLLKESRDLATEKSRLTSIMRAEEKQAHLSDDAIVSMSQTLELLKKKYKEMSAEERESDLGKEVEQQIQDLDAHLKDLSADIGEFQRNVGNYAIAGQNGVVSTESLSAAMSREAVTMQDLIDQTKILEEAKMMLDKNDEHYPETLEAVNNKLEENRRKIADVSDIMDKQATSISEAEAQNKRLKEALKLVDLSAEDAWEQIAELNRKIAENTDIIEDNQPHLQRHSEYMRQMAEENESAADSMLGLFGINNDFASSLESIEVRGNVFDGLKTKVQAFGKTLMGILSNPWVLTFIGIAGGVAVFKFWYDFNERLIEASRLTKNFTGLTGDAADAVTAKMKTMADRMGKGFDETIAGANTLVQQFGLTWDEAAEKIKDGIAAGADMNGEFLANIDKFAPALRDAGVSADEFVAILAETRNGIFGEDGMEDILKAGTRLRSMTKQTEASLDAVGISAKQMQKDLTEGNISMLDAVQQVAQKLQELPENSQEAGLVIKNVFGRTAAEGGQLLIQSIAGINTNLDKAKESMGELGRVNEEQMDAMLELNETMMAVFKMSDTSFEEMIISAKTFVVQGLTRIIKKGAEVTNWVVDLYNKSYLFRGLIQVIGFLFKSLWTTIKTVLTQAFDAFSALGTIIEGAFTLDPDKIKEGFEKGFVALKDNAVKWGKEIGSNAADAFNNTLNGELENVKITLDKDTNDDGSPNGHAVRTGDFNDNEDDDSDKDKSKDAEKAAKEQLKLLQQLEDAKIELMKEGHEKDLTLIRQKFKKKIEEITGNSDTEKSLRLKLLDQMNQELSDCELKYQKELSRINLDNRLASVRKGSKEELDLRLAQIEAERTAELEAAEKTGADKTLIDAKFNRQREDLENEYTSNLADNIQNRYAVGEVMRSQAYNDEVNALKERYAKELSLAGGNAARQEELREQLDKDMFELDSKYARDSAEAAVRMIEEILSLENMSAEDRMKWEMELAKAKMALSGQIADANAESVERQIADDAKLRDKRQENLERWLDVASDTIDNVSSLVNTLFDGQIQKIEEQQEANTEAGEKEQERISQLVEKKVITEEEGEARKRAAEAKTAKKNEELEKKKAELTRKQAVFQKAVDLAQAGIATALAISKALPNFVLAAIAGAMGAVQIATIAATPIPKYRKGTEYHSGGPAIVGDGGRSEVVVYRGDAWITPATPTIVDLPKGAAVVPSIEIFEDRYDMMPIVPHENKVVVNNDYSELKREMANVANLIRNHTRQQRADNARINYEIFKLKI